VDQRADGPDVNLTDALRTTGAVRDFTDRLVDRATVARLLDTARFAPNGGNAQSWRVVSVEDATTRAALRDLYLDGWHLYLAQVSAGLRPWAPITDRGREAEVIAAARSEGRLPGTLGDFAEHFDRIPVLLVVLADLRLLAATDRDLDRYTMVGGASVYPFVWSILLAARQEGLGGVITTMTVAAEPTVKELLGVPDEFAVAAVVALGEPRHQPTRLRRNPVHTFATVDRFDGDPLPMET